MHEAWIEDSDDEWGAAAAAVPKLRLSEAEPTMAVTVVDAPGDRDLLAACATGAVTERLPSPRDRSGLSGRVFNVSTEPHWRRRGFGRACVETLLEWFDDRGVRVVEPRASPQGESLYRQLGFRPSEQPSMRLGPSQLPRRYGSR
jgi:GNAT superfamily N-acetyltransferase